MNTNNNTDLQPGQWLDARHAYIRGQVKTDLPFGAVFLFDVIEEYVPESNQTLVFETWVCE